MKSADYISFEDFIDINNLDIDHQDSRKRTKIGTASKDGKLEIVKSFLRHSANPNILDKDKYTALGMAI